MFVHYLLIFCFCGIPIFARSSEFQTSVKIKDMPVHPLHEVDGVTPHNTSGNLRQLQDNKAQEGFGNLLTEADFEAFFKNSFISLCSFCTFKFGFDIDQSKEVVHAAFIKLWEGRHQLKPGETARNYLGKIIINNAIDILRHQRVRSRYQKYVLSSMLEAVEAEAPQLLDQKELNQAIEAAVAELPEQMRLIYMLSRNSGMKYREIAEHLCISEKTVETQMGRALSKLRQKLSRFLPLYLLLFL